MARGAPDFWLRGTRIDLIDLINKIKEITTIDVISQIRTLDFGYLGQFNVFRNTGFEVGDVEDPKIAVGWEDYLGKRAYETGAFAGKYVFWIGAYTTAWLMQSLEVPIICRRITELSCQAYDVSMFGVRLRFYAIYSDGTSDYHDFWLSELGEWTYCDMTPYLNKDKLLKSIKFMNPDAEDVIMVDEVIGLASSEISVISKRGYDGLTYNNWGTLFPLDVITVCDIPGKGVWLELLEVGVGTDSDNVRLHIDAYDSAGAANRWYHSWANGTVAESHSFFTYPYLRDHKHPIVEVIYENTVKDEYKFGIKNRVYFPRGVRIQLANISDVDSYFYSVNASISVEGD